MTMNTQQTGGTHNTPIPIGAKLQSAREAQRLERKDAAAKLRLNETVIDMIESNTFPATMPVIFVRGYIRAYGRLLQLTDEEITLGLEPIKPPTTAQETIATPAAQTEPARRNLKKLMMTAATVAVVITIISSVAAWWHGHSAKPAAESIALAVPTETPATVANSASTAPIIPLAAPTAAPTAKATNASPQAAPEAAKSPAASIPAYKRAAALSQPPTNVEDADENTDTE